MSPSGRRNTPAQGLRWTSRLGQAPSGPSACRLRRPGSCVRRFAAAAVRAPTRPGRGPVGGSRGVVSRSRRRCRDGEERYGRETPTPRRAGQVAAGGGGVALEGGRGPDRLGRRPRPPRLAGRPARVPLGHRPPRRGGRSFRFLHHSFAEFIAAQSYAELIAADFSDLEEWVRRALAEERRNLGVFGFCMWGRGRGAMRTSWRTDCCSGARTSAFGGAVDGGTGGVLGEAERCGRRET